MGKLLTLVKAICFKGQKGDKGDPGVSVSVGQTTTGDPGTSAAVENVGTASDPILNFTIPKGATGVSVVNIAKTSTSGNVDTYTITMTDGTTYTFTVRNGEHKQAYISQAAYNALVAAGTVDPECYYYIIDDPTGEEIDEALAGLGERADNLEARLDFNGGATGLNGFTLIRRMVNGSLQVSSALPSSGLYLLNIRDYSAEECDTDQTVLIYFGVKKTVSSPFPFKYYAEARAGWGTKSAFIEINENGYSFLKEWETDNYLQMNHEIRYRKIG